MIRKGLKKGDKFEDGGRVFIIEEVLETGNYISREIKEEIDEMPVEAAPKKTRTKKTKEA